MPRKHQSSKEAFSEYEAGDESVDGLPSRGFRLGRLAERGLSGPYFEF